MYCQRRADKKIGNDNQGTDRDTDKMKHVNKKNLEGDKWQDYCQGWSSLD